MNHTNKIDNYIDKPIYPSQLITTTPETHANATLPSQLHHITTHSHQLHTCKPQYGTLQPDCDQYNNNELINKQYGILKYNASLNAYNLQSVSNIYVPHTNDLLIGTIQSKTMEYYRVNLGEHCNIIGMLPLYSFPGASKRNHPNLSLGTLVYCRIESYTSYSHDSIQLTCVTPYIKQSDWVTGNNIFGELSDGYTASISLQYAYKLLLPSCLILNLIESQLKIVYELAIGMNGIVWCNSNSVANTIVIINLILKTEHMTQSQITHEINQFVQRSQ